MLSARRRPFEQRQRAVDLRALDRQHAQLGGDAAARREAAGLAARRHHAMARHDRRKRILPHRLPDLARELDRAEPLGDVAIGERRAGRNCADDGVDPRVEFRRCRPCRARCRRDRPARRAAARRRGRSRAGSRAAGSAPRRPGSAARAAPACGARPPPAGRSRRCRAASRRCRSGRSRCRTARNPWSCAELIKRRAPSAAPDHAGVRPSIRGTRTPHRRQFVPPQRERGVFDRAMHLRATHNCVGENSQVSCDGAQRGAGLRIRRYVNASSRGAARRAFDLCFMISRQTSSRFKPPLMRVSANDAPRVVQTDFDR